MRPLDLLRLDHEDIEAWILEQATPAGAATLTWVRFDAAAVASRLRVVA